MSAKVKVYSTPTCPYCQMVKKFLQEEVVEFEDINVGVNEAARDEMIKISGQMGVPVLDINGKIIIGFDKEAIRKALGK